MQAQVKRRIAFGITTGGLLAGSGLGFAHADAGGSNGGSGTGTSGTSNSPGILSGNSIQIPVDIPINVCGITANVIGLLNPAAGNDCANSGGATASTDAAAHPANGGPHIGTPHSSNSGATAHGGTSDSPGILSGNNVQVPIHVPLNLCGDTVNVVGAKNPALDDHCANGGSATTGGTHAEGGATAHGGTSDSPGILSGNNVQVPIHVPVNACGDTVNVVGLKNEATGNHCANDASGSTGATAHGGASDSPGIGSGNNVQLPIDVPVNLCGDTVNVVGLLNAAHGNECSNGTPHTPPPTTPPTSPSTTPSTTPSTGGTFPPPPPGHTTTPSTPPTSGHTTTPGGPGGSTTPGGPQGSTAPGGQVDHETAPAGSTGNLAHTGSDALMLAPVGVAMIGGGLAMYRKFKPSGSH